MGIQIMSGGKGKGKTVTPVVVVKSELEIKVDRMVELKPTIDEAKKATAEFEKLRKELATLADETIDKELPATYESDTGIVSFTPCSSERKINDMEAVFNLLGKDLFLQLAKISMTDVDKYLTVPDVEKLVSKENTGARKVSVAIKEVKAAA